MTNEEKSRALADMANRFWQFECRQWPLTAALAGEILDDTVLFREAASDHDQRYVEAGHMLQELAGICSDEMSPQDRATYRLLQRELHGIRRYHDVDGHLRPSLFPAGIDFTTVFFANSTSIDDAATARRYLARLESIPGAIRDIQANLMAGHRKGIRYPRIVLDSAVSNIEGLTQGPAQATAWYGPFQRWTAADGAGQALGQRALAFIADRLVPAFQAHAAFLHGPLAMGALIGPACTDGPQGRDFYRMLVQHFTTIDVEPEAVHALGLREVERLQSEIEDLAAKAGFADDVTGYRRFLSTDPQFVAESKDALRADIERLCKRIDKCIPAFFGRIPRITYGVESIPETISAKVPGAYAQPNPADRSAPGIIWVSGIPAKCPSYLHVPLALHEGWPGHLMHIALMQEADSLPSFRRHGAIKYTAYVEGWALYCESLGVEMGLYETTHQHYGRVEMEQWRAVRLVVDTGIHWYGWSRETAIAYMAARLTLSRESIEGEVDRYAAMPAQALAYQIGNLKMRELRQHAQQTLGPRFKHRRFHEAVMCAGAVTLPVLEELIEDWLTSEQSFEAERS
jgi:uncharacterized protein (DUF885 family)